MMRRALLWPLAGGLSIAAHGLFVAGLALAIQPQPFAPQPMPEARLDILEQDVARSTALPATPDAEAAPAAPAQGAALGAAAIPVSAATETKPQAQAAIATPPAPASPALAPEPLTVTARTPDSPVQRPDRPEAQVIAAGSASAPTQRAAEPEALAIAASRSEPPALRASAASAPRTSAAALPSEPAAPAPDAAMPLPALPPPATPATPRAPAAAAAPPLPPPASRATASLAWTGETGSVDPVSLAAISAFMQPDDLAGSDSNAGQVRDGIAAVLAAVPCARLQTSFDPETGTLDLRGHLPEDALRGPVLAALRAQIGAAIPVADKLLVLPRPQCGALSGIAAVGLPQSDEQITNPRVVGPDAYVRDYRYTEGQRLELDLAGPDYASFIYVDYFDADGNVIHLQPNEVVPLAPVAPKATLSVGREQEGRPALNITIAPPFGQEIAVAFATSVPLYDGLRPMVEPAAPYLAFLRDRVAQARGAHADFKGEWVYFFISTAAE